MEEFLEVKDLTGLRHGGLRRGLVFVYKERIYVCMNNGRQVLITPIDLPSGAIWCAFDLNHFLTSSYKAIYQLNTEGEVFKTVQEFVLTHGEQT